MLRKLYTSSGLILVAILAAGIWTSNIQDFLTDKNAPQVGAVAAPSPSREPTPDELMRKWKQERPQSTVDYFKITPTPAPKLSAVEIFERRQRERDEAGDRMRAWRQAHPTPFPNPAAVSDALRQSEVNTGATAICRDGTYSYSANRRGTCSHHGGVAQWLSR